MRKAMIAAVVFVSLVACQAQAQVSGGARGSQPTPDNIITVAVEDVDTNQKKFTAVSSGGKTIPVTITPDTLIVGKDGTPKQLSDLKKGARAKVTYSGEKDTPTAMRVEIE